jgi:hypothetical protein
MGRKIKEDPKAKIISIAMTREQYDQVLSFVPKGMNLSTYGRLKLLGEIK